MEREGGKEGRKEKKESEIRNGDKRREGEKEREKRKGKKERKIRIDDYWKKGK